MKNLEIDRDGTKGWTAKGMSETSTDFHSRQAKKAP